MSSGDSVAGVATPGPFDDVPHSRWPRLRPAVVGVVFVGGCVGGLARYEVVRAWPAGRHGFPWSIFAVNDVGAFVLALLLVVAAGMLPPPTYVRPLIGTGFCGAFTTFGAVVATADELVAHGHAGTAAGYVVASVAAGLAAAIAGLVAGRWLVTHRPSYPGGTSA